MKEYFGLPITEIKETPLFGIVFTTSYGLKYTLKADLNGITDHFDLMQAKLHMQNFKCVILDEFESPIDNDFDLYEIITQQKNYISIKKDAK